MAKQHERSTHNWSEKQNRRLGRWDRGEQNELLCADGKGVGGRMGARFAESALISAKYLRKIHV